MILKTEVKTLPIALISWSLLSLPSKAQVIPDKTLGTENSTVNSTLINNIPSERIDGGATRGTNLFHSFETFNVEPGLGVYFSNPAIIENIISRVTGNNPSQIMGTLGVLGDANLFLINPNGIIFGSEASLDIKGSFIGSSASSVIFEGFEFTTENPQAPPLLTINMPLGLGFNDNPGTIVNQSVVAEIVTDDNGEILREDLIGLRVEPNQTLALIGGNISVAGGFVTIDGGGRIELGSVGGKSQVGLIPTETGWQLSHEEVLDFQDISLSGAAFIANVGASDDIKLQGRNITLTEGSLIVLENQGVEKAGNLIVKASESLTLSGGINFGDFFPSSLNLQSTSGVSGDLLIETKNLILRDGAQILANTFGGADAGNINILASESIKLIGTESGIIPSGIFAQVRPEATGDGGNLDIDTNTLIIEEGAQIATATFGSGSAGDVNIETSLIELNSTNPQETISSSLSAQVEPGATGDGGTINISTDSLVAKQGAQITASTFSVGNAGNINIEARDSIQLTGTSATFGIDRSSGIFVSAQSLAIGNVGELKITTDSLTVEQGARISANNAGTGEGGNATLNVNQLTVKDGGLVGAASLLGRNPISNERGDGGTFTVNANTVEVRGVSTIAGEEVKSSLFTLAEGTGDGGNLNIVTSSLSVKDEGEINVSSTSKGSAGNLEITANSVVLDNGNLNAETQIGAEGNIILKADNIVLQNGNGSLISTNTQSSSGGNISITTDTLVAFDNSDITANAIQGQGGEIKITAEAILGIEPRPQLTPLSDITAFSEQDPQLDGMITIETPDFDFNREFAPLPIALVDVTGLITQGCPAGNRGTKAESQFVITGRGGLSPRPDELLRTPAIIIDDDILATENSEELPPVISNPIVEANSWMVNDRGKVVLIALNSAESTAQYGVNSAKCHDF